MRDAALTLVERTPSSRLTFVLSAMRTITPGESSACTTNVPLLPC